jgi:hypothetical protein
MPVIARDAVAADHLVYAWPFPIGPEEYEVACADDEQVVMCPAWIVGDRLGPGRHRWRSPDPMRPAAAYFVLVAPVEVSFDVATSFLIPMTGQGVRLRATGSLQVRCLDPALLVAQFVGLPFDQVNDGVLRSVSRSIERMLARLLTRRVVMAGSPAAVTDPAVLPGIVEELVAYNPTAGAVFGIELMRVGHLSVAADDGSLPWHAMQPAMRAQAGHGANGEAAGSNPHLEFQHTPSRPDIVAGEIGGTPPARPSPPPIPAAAALKQTLPPPMSAQPRAQSPALSEASGEIVVKPKGSTPPPIPAAAAARGSPVPGPAPAALGSHVEVPSSTDDITQPGVDIVRTPLPGSLQAPMAEPAPNAEPRGSILGIGMSAIGSSPPQSEVVSGEISRKIAPGGRVLVPGPNGLMQSATVRQLLQGYYELEVGGSGETIWVPVNGVVPE